VENILFKFTVAGFALAVTFVFGYLLFFNYMFGAFDKSYTPKELIKIYNDRKAEIDEARYYFKKIVPEGKFIEIEFKDDHTIYRMGVAPIDSSGKWNYENMFLAWDLKINGPRMDSLLHTLNWDKVTLMVLKEKLDRAGCIQIESGEPITIGFQRSGLGMYSFKVFERAIPDSLLRQYNDSCTYLFINRKLVLEYEGGAVGNQCFPLQSKR
jgi:hypothetical protein